MQIDFVMLFLSKHKKHWPKKNPEIIPIKPPNNVIKMKQFKNMINFSKELLKFSEKY